MKIKRSVHGAYHQRFYMVRSPKYRKKVLKGEVKQYLEKGLRDIERFHPDIAIKQFSMSVKQFSMSVGFFSSPVGVHEDIMKR